jgi:large subunit ribosomal protein L5
MSENPMRQIRVKKVVLNIGCGTKLPVEHALALLKTITDRQPVITRTHKRTTFGTPRGKPIGAKVTLRGKPAIQLLKRLLQAKDNKLPASCFDRNGNFSFGISEYIDVPGVAYNPKIGIFGFDVSVELGRPGWRVKERKMSHPIGKKHLISTEEAMNFMQKEFGVSIG